MFPALAGMFVAVVQGPGGRRAYVDSGAQIPLLWSEHGEGAASSPALLLSPAEARKRFDRELWQRLVVREGNGWISGTLTAHRGLRRLLPGHWLDLETGHTKRFWPRRESLGPTLSVSDAARQAGAAIRRLVEGVVVQCEAAISLTAGFDSRVLLAASRDVRRQAQYYTIDLGGVDSYQAPRIAEQLGLSHQLVKPVLSGPEDISWWDDAVGHCVREQNRSTYLTLGGIGPSVLVQGAFGEAGRGRLYRQDAERIDAIRPDPAFLASRLTIPAAPEHFEELERWLEPLAGLPTSVVMDLAYIELRGASWAMAQAPAQKAIRPALAPFAQRATFDAFLRTPPRIKADKTLFRTMLEQLWPEAAAFPINRFGDYRDRLGLFYRRYSREQMVRFLRDRMAF